MKNNSVKIRLIKAEQMNSSYDPEKAWDGGGYNQPRNTYSVEIGGNPAGTLVYQNFDCGIFGSAGGSLKYIAECGKETTLSAWGNGEGKDYAPAVYRAVVEAFEDATGIYIPVEGRELTLTYASYNDESKLYDMLEVPVGTPVLNEYRPISFYEYKISIPRRNAAILQSQLQEKIKMREDSLMAEELSKIRNSLGGISDAVKLKAIKEFNARYDEILACVEEKLRKEFNI